MGRISATKTGSKPRLTLVVLSDTHELHRDLDVPDSDKRVRPKLHLFGHAHAGYGTFTDDVTTYVNASLMSSFGALDKRPLLFEFKAT
jgi:hypothetical protein